MNRFLPLMTQPSGVFSALVWMLLASDPTSGSVSAKAAMSSPLARRGMCLAFCAAVPPKFKDCPATPLWMLIKLRMAGLARLR